MVAAKGEEDVTQGSQPNPIKTASFFSKLFFCWLLPLFKYGYGHTLESENLYQTLPEDSSKQLADELTKEWLYELEKERRTGKEASLLKAIIRTCRWHLLLYGIVLFFMECIFKLAQPLLIGYLVQYFVVDSEMTTEQAYLCALGLCFCVMGVTILTHPMIFFSSRIGMRIRVGVSALVYRKALKLSRSALGKTTVGQLVNILSNDVSRFDMAFHFIHYVWIGPIQIIFMVGVLWCQMGPTCLVALVTLLLMALVQAFMGRMFSKLRARIALLTDERVRVMNEIIAGMRIIKIHAWEMPFTELVEEARRRESRHIHGTSYLRAFNHASFFVASKVIAFATFVVFAALENAVSISLVFISLPLFNLVRITVTVFIPYCTMRAMEGLVSVRRIKKFLLMDEMPPSANHLDHPVSDKYHIFGDVTKLLAGWSTEGIVKLSEEELVGEPFIVMDMKRSDGHENDGEEKNWEADRFIQISDLAGSWDEEGRDKCLDRLNFVVKPGELVAVIGPVGCGKSSLLMALLGELPYTSGHISYRGRVAYTSQQPWVFSGTLRENILFGHPYDKEKYNMALSVCALTRDIMSFSDGDQTLVGERGIMLSGGQKARVGLARAVYEDADIYLLDDPLSAVDTAVGRHLFDRCITGHLKRKSVILITHQLRYLRTVDRIMILKEGKMVDCGSFEYLQTEGYDFAALLKEFEGEESTEADSRTPGIIKLGASEVTSPEDVALADDYTEVDNKETKVEGDTSAGIYIQYIRAGSKSVPFIFFMICNILAQVFCILFDFWLPSWAYIEETCMSQFTEDSCVHNSTVLGDFTDYPVVEVGRSFFFYVWLLFLFLLILFSFVRTNWLFYICVNASVNLHNKMFAAVIRAPMKFFDTNPTGRILNRFSKDIGFMDELLPSAFAGVNSIAVNTAALLITICVFNPSVLLFAIPLGGLSIFCRNYYLATSRDIKRMEAVCRSPVFSHLSSTLQGLTTVRAFRAQRRLVTKFDMYQDAHTEAWFTFLATAQWFGIVLDWLTTFFLVAVSFGSVFSKHYLGLDPVEVGLSLTYCLNLIVTFQFGLRQSVKVENLMTSTERVIEYTKLEPEAPLESIQALDPDWPWVGGIEFDKVSLKYSEDGPTVLDKITMKIAPREKIGIVGRTGAGKSSLTVALLRLVEPEGTIKVDGVDLSKLGLHDVRKNIASIPQDPTLFSGSLRRNLDPFSEHNDVELWDALKEVELQSVIRGTPDKLNMMVSEGGTNFSIGQRQLLCLARAILSRNKILLVDEATANVDIRTDKLIQATIRKRCNECTVLMIAHRLDTIMDSDRILVLKEGRIVELDRPYLLLQDKGSLLSQLVAETGTAESARLISIAKQKHFEVEVQEEQSNSGGQDELGGNSGDKEYSNLDTDGRRVLESPEEHTVEADERTALLSSPY